ncbi:glycoside hydrolase family 27 protein [Compostibacter hankyongensis]|uniref:Alpha-galactosidase n=1 Tax=Compostibacter hankyongensis TaxID=1007089 RepID=A0ABP8FJY4_9BACT
MKNILTPAGRASVLSLFILGILISGYQTARAETHRAPVRVESNRPAAKLDIPAKEDTLPASASGPLAPAPPMGWNSWNWFGKKNINEKVVREVIDAIVKEGLRDAGYRYVIVDGGWRDTVLDANGGLRPNPIRFPHGIKALADYAHAKGLKFGLHTVPGTRDCGGDKVGGYGHEAVQIQQFADWGIDFIKLDKCRMQGNWDEAQLKAVYFKWAGLIRKSGRDMVLSISAYKFRDWNPEAGQMSRTTPDIRAKCNGGAVFENPHDGRKAPLSVMDIAEMNSLSAQYARPGYWNDPDMLVTGDQGLTPGEQRAHFALWCIMSAPLFLGNDPIHMSPEEKSIILNKASIAVDQDPTEQGKRVKVTGDTEIWAKKLKGGKAAILLLNRNSSESKPVTLKFRDIGLPEKVKVKEVYSGKDLGAFTGNITREIKPHSGLFLVTE